MTYAVIWLPEAMTAYRRLRRADVDGAKRITRIIAALATDPRPATSSALGGTAFRRLRLDDYRVLYEVTGEAVYVLHIGRVPRR